MKRFIGRMMYKYYYGKYHNMIEESKKVAQKRKEAKGIEKRRFGIEFDKLAQRKREIKKVLHKWEQYGNIKAYKYKNWYEKNKVEVNEKRAFKRKLKAQEELMKQKEIEQQQRIEQKRKRLKDYYQMTKPRWQQYYKEYYKEHKQEYKDRYEKTKRKDDAECK